MRSFGDLPRIVLILEGIGITLLVLAYLVSHSHINFLGIQVSPPVAIAMIFFGVALVVPAAVFLVWRVVVQRSSMSMRMGDPPKNDRANKKSRRSRD